MSTTLARIVLAGPPTQVSRQKEAKAASVAAKDFVLKKLLPERRGGEIIMASPGCCSCCCCCCLHSAGSLVGAMFGSRVKVDGENAEVRARSKRAARNSYWILVLISAVVEFVIVATQNDSELGLILLAITFPALQLGAAVLALPVLWLKKSEGGGKAPYKQLGKITLYSILGGLVGGLITAAMMN